MIMGKSYSRDLFGDQSHYYGGGSHGGHQHCYHSHPKIELGGGTFIGGSCSNPVTESADIYIGFDHSMTHIQAMPWDGPTPLQLFYPITDMAAPSNSKSFIKLIDWSAEQLLAGKTIHAGCIGGHGRTGTYLSALWKVVKGEEDAIFQVRKAYCHKAVESASQVNFLHKHFGIKKIDGTKEVSRSVHHIGGGLPAPKPQPARTGGAEIKSPSGGCGSSTRSGTAQQFKDAQLVFNPVKSKACMWGHVL